MDVPRYGRIGVWSQWHGPGVLRDDMVVLTYIRSLTEVFDDFRTLMNSAPDRLQHPIGIELPCPNQAWVRPEQPLISSTAKHAGSDRSNGFSA